ncbi:MAG: hypothetical protein ACAI34_14870 [Verrucomicrobium sp.]
MTTTHTHTHTNTTGSTEHTQVEIRYEVHQWNERYENNRSRELKKLDWVPMGNAHDTFGYCLTLAQEDGPQLMGAWLAIVQVASRCIPRGSLVRDNGTPYTAATLAAVTRFPMALLERALQWFASPDIQWLVVAAPPRQPGVQGETPTDATATAAAEVAKVKTATPVPAPACGEEKGSEAQGTEGIPETTPPDPLQGKGVSSHKSSSSWEPDALQRRINTWFHRRDSTRWSHKERQLYDKLDPAAQTSPDDLDLLERYMQACEFRRRDLLTLLNHWNGELDRARQWSQERQSPPPHSALRTSPHLATGI